MRFLGVLLPLLLVAACSSTETHPIQTPTPSPASSASASGFTDAELGYLKARGISPDDDDAAPLQVENAHNLCGQLVGGTRYDRLLAWLESGDGAAIDAFCPDEATVAQDATDSHAWADGEFDIPDEVQPGFYITVNPIVVCKWVRYDQDYDAVDRLTIRSKKVARLVIQKTDGSVETDGCGVWVRDPARY